VKRISSVIIAVFLFSFLSFPNASGFELKSECISTTMVSQYPFPKPGPGNTAEYKIAYQNNCSKEISSVEISIMERDGYDYRILTSGGRLGKVLDKQKGQVTLSLSYSVFSEVRDTMFLSIKENYPLESKVKQSMRNLDFTSAPTPAPTPSGTSVIPWPGDNLPPGTYPGGSGPQSSPSPSACDVVCQAAKAAVVKAAADKAAADKAAADKAAADKAAADKAAAEVRAAADKFLADAKAEAAAILAAAQLKAAAQKKTTITCVKGKLTKKVTAVKPKCPTGYKKK
jgi:hypothetical protein